MRRLVVLLLCVVTSVTCSYGQETLEVVWDEGLKFRSRDRAWSVEIGGRLHYDISFLKHDRSLTDAFGTAGDKVEVRRARISMEGTIRNVFEYEFEVSFADEFEFKDMSLTFLKIPHLERLTVGHFREPFGLEENTSSNVIPFMERSLTSAFGPSRNTGVMVQHHFFADMLGIHAGAFRITDDFGSDREAEGKHSFSARAGFMPVTDTIRNRTVHLGMGFNTQTLVENILEIETQNESNTSPNYISTGELENVERLWQLGGEAGLTTGPFSFQSEYIHAFALLTDNSIGLPNNNLHKFRSYYLSGSYFLGGGRRSYDISDNTFSDIALKNRGAWEVALRYSHIHLQNSTQEFSKLDDFTLGLNYYISASTRLMLNYIFSRIEEEHQAQVLQFRLQVKF